MRGKNDTEHQIQQYRHLTCVNICAIFRVQSGEPEKFKEASSNLFIWL